MLKDHIIVIFTAEGCGVCSMIRNSGEFGPNYDSSKDYSFRGHKWNATFFWQLLTGELNPVDAGQKTPMSQEEFTIYEVHMESLAGRTLENIGDYTNFFMDVQQNEVHIRRKKQTKSGYTVLDDSIPVQSTTSYNKLLKKTFPRSLENYLYLYPTFAVFSLEEWEKGLADPNYPIYGRINGLPTIRSKGKWTCDFKAKYDPKDMIEWAFVVKGLDLIPPNFVDEEISDNTVKIKNLNNSNFAIVPLYDSKEYKLIRN